MVTNDAVLDPSAPVSCPLITPDTWEIWSAQHYSPPLIGMKEIV